MLPSPMRVLRWSLLGCLCVFGCESELPVPREDAAADMRARDMTVDSSPLRDMAVDANIPDANIQDANIQDANIPDAMTVDDLSLDSVTWLHPDISSWPVTTDLSIDFTSNSVCLRYDKKNTWDTVTIFGSTDVVANAWVFAQRNGRWYAGTFEWMRPGQECKAMSAVEGGHIKVSPFDEASGWQPQSGEELYFMVSGLIRNPSYRNVMERSNVVRVTWP